MYSIIHLTNIYIYIHVTTITYQIENISIPPEYFLMSFLNDKFINLRYRLNHKSRQVTPDLISITIF